jgi:tripartite-type tricarboxylate transporter receptor subunit TctC
MRTLIAATLSLLPFTAQADSFPERAVTLIIPFAAAGSTDLIARNLANELRELWNQPVIVESRPGAGSMIGTTMLSQAPADGYTLMVTTTAFTTAPAIIDNLSFDPATDIQPIAMAGFSPLIIAAGANVQSDNLADFLEEARERPMFVATPGVGSMGHFAGELFIAGSEIDMDLVHYGGGGEAVTDLMGGHADILINTTAAIMPHVRSGNLRALGILGVERDPGLPDLSTTAELGIETPDVGGWIAVMGPGGMSAELTERLHADLTTAMQSEGFLELLETNQMSPMNLSTQEFEQRVREDARIWAELVRERNITVD